jgi:non-heme chloroperoxidase
MRDMEPTLTRFDGFEGIHLVADVWGAPDAWPVLLMHGGGQTRHAWGGAAQTLAANGWRAVSLDLRGHGDSEWALNGDYSFTAFANDAIAVADQLGKPPVLVGASLGGVASIIA